MSKGPWPALINICVVVCSLSCVFKLERLGFEIWLGHIRCIAFGVLQTEPQGPNQ